MDTTQLAELLERVVREAVAPLHERVAALEEQVGKALSQPHKEYLSLQEVAAMTGRTAKHLCRLIQAGKLPATNVGRGKTPRYNVSRADLHAFMQQNRSGGRVPPPAEQDELIGRYLPRLRRPA
jgi:excisionase family DNA binding protein